jgi:putative two-component system response regulator
MSPADAGRLRIAATLHDIGKRRIPKHILNKRGSLTAEETEVMKTHTTLGASMLESVQNELGTMARDIALWHHEREDGCGYHGKRLSDLPRYVSIAAICDVFTALICERPYKRACSPDEAFEYLQAQAGAHFDRNLTELFIRIAKYDSRVFDIFTVSEESVVT